LFFCLFDFFIEKQMTHPITPPPELVEEWTHLFVDHTDTEVFSAVAQWGADQELEACCEWLLIENSQPCSSGVMRAVRRPKPPSLKEQALAALLHLDHGQHNERCLIIRQALEQLDD
jgi:hypothetical protein